ncbi:Psf3p [Malassezia vespertilionis]|uniref:DNA replication complex GINS protein PSF3 n=1 Tax=Malassezia vespertilionis TaxID=2020962 RepID=A0A2N1JEY9_9BASI|nr:Psf3p [Malassezia vespertilionis]
MDLDYWNVEDIITESQRLPCVFNVDVPGLGYLEDSGEADMHKHARVELAYWMAHLLAAYNIVTIQQPRAYGPRVRSALDASPVAVQLRTLLPHWYAMGIRLAQLLDSEDLRAALYKTYMGRLARIYELSILLAGSRSSASEIAAKSSDPTLTTEMQAFLQGLDDSETALLSAGQ